MKKRCLIIIIGLMCFRSMGQLADLNWHALGIKDGLSETINAFVFKDSRGFVWISSVSGLNRYDGTGIKVYQPDKNDPSTLLGPNIQSSFFEDPQQDLWFTTFDALHKYNYASDCFDHYQVMKDPDTPRLGYHIFYLDPDQYLWMLVEFRMVYTFHIPSGKIEFRGNVSLNSIRCFNVTDETGRLKKILIRGRDWSGLEEVTVGPDRMISAPFKLTGKEPVSAFRFKQAAIQGDSIYWLLRQDAVIKYHVHRQQLTVIPTTSQMECMVRYKDSLLLIGTISDGMKVFNTRRTEFMDIKGSTGPTNRFGELLKISYITMDRDGNIWTSTEGVGLHYARPEKNKFKTIRFADLEIFQNDVRPIGMFEEKDGRILCITDIAGAFIIDQSNLKVSLEPFAPLKLLGSKKVIQVVKDASKRYWISTWSGIYMYPDRYGQLSIVTPQVAQTLAASPDGRVYFTPTVQGLYECYFNHELPGVRPLETIAKKVYASVSVDHKNRIWLYNLDKLFEIYQPENQIFLDTIPLNCLVNLVHVSPDGKKIFVGAYEGLFEINESTLQLQKIYTEQKGFQATSVFSMINDRRGTIWFGHTNGLASLDPASGSFHFYSHEDGLPLASYTEAACLHSSGNVYFGSVGGITVFHPDSLREIQTTAIPQILSLQLNDKEPVIPVICTQTGATHLPAIEKIILPYRQNTISFTIHSLEYSAPEANKVSFKMEGLDEDFLEGKNGDRVRYPSMAAGSYRFILQAYNSDGLLNPVPRILEITVRSPYYKTWWFMSLVALLCFSIVGYIFYLRFSKKLELQQVRLKLYENLHDDVGSRLTAIVLSAEDLERNDRISHPKLTSIAQIARSIVGNMRRLVWAIDPENDRMTSIVQKITHDKSQILSDEIDFSIQVEPGLRNVILPGEFRYQICSICNESFNNISKYASASQVNVKITREHKNILLTVEDNGKGFDPEAARKNEVTGSGYGLSNMHRRASRIGGSFQIHSIPGKGTKIAFRFPYKG